jgi:Predicted ICC-like phosphoesterases
VKKSEPGVSIVLAGEEVVALPDRALFWRHERTLFVADVHLGKDATFRSALRWVPPGTTRDDLARLARLVEQTGAMRLVLLGDVFHSQHADELQAIAQWRNALGIDVRMVEGNHDRRAHDLAHALGIEVLREDYRLGPWRLRHHPTRRSGDGYVLCGHIHPVVRTRGPARQSLRVPCFWIGRNQCVLPAFGGFTGGGVVRPATGDRVLLIVDGGLIDAPLARSSSPGDG